MKKVIAVILVLITMLSIAFPASAAEARYADAQTAICSLAISSSGKATIVVRITGYSSLTKSVAVTYIEKKVGSTWTRVDIGTTDDTWQYTSTSANVAKTYSAQLSSIGEYRAVTTFTLTGSTVETVTKTSTATYS